MKGLLIILALAHGADTVTTCAALRQPGLRESNPVLATSCASTVAINAGLVVAEHYLLTKVHQTKPTLATYVTVGLIAGKSGAAGWNLSILIHRPVTR